VPLADAVMAPTRIYVKPLLALMQADHVKGMAHITGGGLTENIPRVLPEHLTAWSSARNGPCRRCSSGCRRKARSPMPRCTASSTAASAWW
jgi:hypothetical protein